MSGRSDVASRLLARAREGLLAKPEYAAERRRRIVERARQQATNAAIAEVRRVLGESIDRDAVTVHGSDRAVLEAFCDPEVTPTGFWIEIQLGWLTFALRRCGQGWCLHYRWRCGRCAEHEETEPIRELADLARFYEAVKADGCRLRMRTHGRAS